MSCHALNNLPANRQGAAATVAVVGNPNTGKTTLFNALTGLRQHTANYAGVTVEKKVGLMNAGPARPGAGRRWFARAGGSLAPADRPIELVDLPGAYSLAAASPDELIAADVLLGQQAGERLPDAVLVVADASNLERNLYLVSQVVECGRPVVLALNMTDVAERQGLRIDAAGLGRDLGCQAVPVVATRGRGVGRLRAAIRRAIDPAAGVAAPMTVPLGEPLEAALADLLAFLRERQDRLARPVHRVEAMRVLLDRDGPAERRMVKFLGPALADRLAQLRRSLTEGGVELEVIEPRVRYERISQIVSRRLRRQDRPVGRPWTERVDDVLTRPVAGLAVFLAVMAIMFQAIYAGAAPLMEAIDGLFAMFGQWVGSHLPAGAARSLVQDGMIAGVGAVLVFLPQILILFALLAVLEDCGYLARGAFVMDRLLSRFGLSGRSFVPLLACFACTVPGIMAARVIENRRDRIVTILVSPLLSCSARLPVYVLLISAFVPDRFWLGGLVSLRGLTLLALYALGVVVAIPAAGLFKRLVLGGRTPALLMEMPPFRWPGGKAVAMRVYDRGRAFVTRAGTVILLVTVIVWALSYFPRPGWIEQRYEQRRAEAAASLSGQSLEAAMHRLDGEQASAYVEHSLLGRAGRAVEPAFRPLGWDWRIATAVLASFPARELIVSSLGTLYGLGDGATGPPMRPQDGASAPSVSGRPAERLPFSPLVALSLIVFVALCCQCAATLAVIRRETLSWRWPLIAFSYMTALAYLAALAAYQVGLAFGLA